MAQPARASFVARLGRGPTDAERGPSRSDREWTTRAGLHLPMTTRHRPSWIRDRRSRDRAGRGVTDAYGRLRIESWLHRVAYVRRSARAFRAPATHWRHGRPNQIRQGCGPRRPARTGCADLRLGTVRSRVRRRSHPTTEVRDRQREVVRVVELQCVGGAWQHVALRARQRS